MEALPLNQIISIIVDKTGFSNEEIEQAQNEFKKRNDDYWSKYSSRKKCIEQDLEYYKLLLRSAQTLTIGINYDHYAYDFIVDFFEALEEKKNFKSYPGQLSKVIGPLANELYEINVNEPDWLRHCYKFPGEKEEKVFGSLFPDPFTIVDGKNIQLNYLPSVGYLVNSIYHKYINNIIFIPVFTIESEQSRISCLKKIKEFFLLFNIKQGGRDYSINKFVIVLAINDAASQIDMIKKIQFDLFEFIYKIRKYLCYTKFDLIFYEYSDNRKLWNTQEKVMERLINNFGI